jgi:hypothetical protein
VHASSCAHQKSFLSDCAARLSDLEKSKRPRPLFFAAGPRFS